MCDFGSLPSLSQDHHEKTSGHKIATNRRLGKCLISVFYRVCSKTTTTIGVGPPEGRIVARIFSICVLQVEEQCSIQERVVFPRKYHHFGAPRNSTRSQVGPMLAQAGPKLAPNCLKLASSWLSDCVIS